MRKNRAKSLDKKRAAKAARIINPGMESNYAKKVKFIKSQHEAGNNVFASNYPVGQKPWKGM